MFRFTSKRVTTAAALVLLLGTTAYASSVHLKPPNSKPSFTDNGLTLRASASLSGLGGGDIVINMSATAEATATCTNPGSGATQPPGQNPADVTVSGSQTIPQDQIKNGNVSFSVTTVPPVSPIAGAPGCPNSQWTEDITDLSFKTANITVDQPAGTLVLTVMCTFNPATSNGPVDSRTVTCTAS
jgi:hypothetical protein